MKATRRRTSYIDLTPDGRQLLEQVFTRRHHEITRIVDTMTPEQQDGVIDALQTFATAAGEIPEQAWSWGWWSSDHGGATPTTSDTNATKTKRHRLDPSARSPSTATPPKRPANTK